MKTRNATPEAYLVQFARERGILRAADLAERGIPRWALSRLVESGDLVHVGRGLYRYAGAQPTEHHTNRLAVRFGELRARAPFDKTVPIESQGARDFTGDAS
jgi:hypothetical protein